VAVDTLNQDAGSESKGVVFFPVSESTSNCFNGRNRSQESKFEGVVSFQLSEAESKVFRNRSRSCIFFNLGSQSNRLQDWSRGRESELKGFGYFPVLASESVSKSFKSWSWSRVSESDFIQFCSRSRGRIFLGRSRVLESYFFQFLSRSRSRIGSRVGVGVGGRSRGWQSYFFLVL